MADPSATPIIALTEALTLLVPFAPPGRAEQVLRQAIARLVAEENRPLVSREPIDDADLEHWAALKASIRDSGIAGAEIARQLGIGKSAIDHVLLPSGRAPSTQLFEAPPAPVEIDPAPASVTDQSPSIHRLREQPAVCHRRSVRSSRRSHGCRNRKYASAFR
jgi:hypothetical protein